MRYSLLSRFQGGLLGSVLGEGVAKSDQTPAFQTPTSWQKIGFCAAQSLIEVGRLDVGHWIGLIEREDASLLNLKQKGNSSEVAIATLPIVLFFHESPTLLQEQLYTGADLWLQPNIDRSDVLRWGYAIALALCEKLDPTQILAQLLSAFEMPETPLLQQLQQVQTFLAQGTSLETVASSLFSKKDQSSEACLAFAFYCFLSTPEDFNLSVRRAAKKSPQPQITAALTGVLSGIYNGVTGIAIAWRFAYEQQNPKIAPLKIAKRLFAVWSGVYSPDDENSKKLLTTAIASPRILQPRLALYTGIKERQ